MISDNDLRWFAARLSIAVYDTNADYYRQRWEDEQMATLAEQIKEAKAKLADTRAAAGSAVAEAIDVATQLEQETAKVVKDTQDLRNEMVGLTNGGPPLDTATPMPPRGYPT